MGNCVVLGKKDEETNRKKQKQPSEAKPESHQESKTEADSSCRGEPQGLESDQLGSSSSCSSSSSEESASSVEASSLTWSSSQSQERPGSTELKASFPARRDSPLDFYTFGEEIGSGGFSVVRTARKKSDGTKVAVKIIKRSNVTGLNEKQQAREIEILLTCDHPNIVNLHEVFDYQGQLYLIMELVEGRDLFDELVKRGRFSERGTAKIMKQVLSGVQYLHSKGIAHRDLKPENLIAVRNLRDSVTGLEHSELEIKILDFGFSKNGGDSTMKTSCGSPLYVAPEILTNDSYDKSVDMWSLGVIMYILLSGYPPFIADTDISIYKKIMACKWNFQHVAWDNVSVEAKDLLRGLLVKNPKKRLTAEQCLRSDWVQGIGVSGEHKADRFERFKEFNAVRAGSADDANSNESVSL
ncbi:Mitogen-activated protein kinase cpk1 [Balamuthia mandrillaris]